MTDPALRAPESGPRGQEDSGAWRGPQRDWAAIAVRDRMLVLRSARQRMAVESRAFAAAISVGTWRQPAETLIAEVLPLLDACKFLEREAEGLLAARRLGRRGLPFWLAGIDSEVRRVALGKVLVIGPANYPLFIPGVQALQALAAGNAVVWKPGRGGKAVAKLFAESMSASGLPRGLLRVAEESVEAGRIELGERTDKGPDKVFFTGSAETGSAVMAHLAERAIPSVMELSGCDAVVVLPTADLARVAAALAFGMRLNASATCMAPRRVFVLEGQDAAMQARGERKQKLIEKLRTTFNRMEGVALAAPIGENLRALLEQASRMGAEVHGELTSEQRPILVTSVDPRMEIACADFFAPVLMMMNGEGEAGILQALDSCPFALTAAIFGDERQARALAGKISAGTVVINDLIVPTVDPRIPFGGRRRSGFGVTRGAEGLLEMTAVQAVVVRRGRSQRHYEPTTSQHADLFEGLIETVHAAKWRDRWGGIRRLVAAGRSLNKR